MYIVLILCVSSPNFFFLYLVLSIIYNIFKRQQKCDTCRITTMKCEPLLLRTNTKENIRSVPIAIRQKQTIAILLNFVGKGNKLMVGNDYTVSSTPIPGKDYLYRFNVSS